MPKRNGGVQIEMLLPIAGKRPDALTPNKKMRDLSYDKIVASLRKKGLVKSSAAK